MQYIVVPTSNSDYQSWQCRLLNWSRKKVKQEGKLIFLRCDDEMGKNRPRDVYTDTDVEVIDLPDYALEWENIEENARRGQEHWWGAIPNKYMSIKWLCDNNYMQDDDILLFLDPDMIFLEAINYQPDDNEVIAQRFIHYYPIKGWTALSNEEYGKGIMYPFCINFRTLKRIVDDYKLASEEIRRVNKRWEAEMWGLDYAVKKNNLQITYVEDFGYCTAWKNAGDMDVSKLIHFPNEIKDLTQSRIWFKQDYTQNSNMPIQIELAKNAIDKRLLLNVSQERSDFLYYLKWDTSDIFKFYDGTNGYIIFRPWPGGFNNIRMSLELAVCIAYLSNKTLVLPPKYKMYLLKDEFGLEDFFDINDLGIHVLSFEDFCQMKGIEPSFGGVSTIAKTMNEEVPRFILNFEKILPKWDFTKGREIINQEDFMGNDECVFFDGSLLGNFYQTIHTSKDIELKRLVARHVHYKTELTDMAWEAINWLGDQQYYAIHIRRNDFQYKHLFISAEEILNNIKDVIPKGSRLYIATDEPNRTFFNPLASYYKLYFYDEVAKATNLTPHYNYIPIIEQLICSRAIKFVGNDYSTLSSYVYRLRGYMSDIHDKLFYVNTNSFDNEQQQSFLEVTQFIANWAREYKDAWDFSHKRIFVSVASYNDTQLIPTIRDLYDTAQNPNRITVGVHVQHDEAYYNLLLNENFPNIKIIYTPKEESKGVVWARERIKTELYNNEDYFFQIDAHSRFRPSWDNILINQLHASTPDGDKALLSTYPNHFDLFESKQEYINRTPTNAPLIIKGFLNDDLTDNRIDPKNIGAMSAYEIVDNKWIAGGFIFAPAKWLEEVKVPAGIVSKGEEDSQFFLSYLYGWHIKLAAEAVVWHNYNVVDLNGTTYRHPNLNPLNDNSINIINDILFNTHGQRHLGQLEEYVGLKFKPIATNKTIFVALTSFIDPDLRNTILSCVQQAEHPENLRIGLILQYDDNSSTNERCVDDLIERYNIRVKKIPYENSLGGCWARNQVAELLQDEKYIFQIDAHTRLAKNWDTHLINELESINEKAIISYLSPPFYRNKEAGLDHFFQYIENPFIVNVPKITEITEDYWPKFVGYTNEQHTQNRIRQVPILYAGFVFAPASWYDEVRNDPDHYYTGEEFALSIRSYTHGYNIYQPSRIISWHKSDPEHKHHFKVLLTGDELHAKAMTRLKLLIEGGDLGRYGLGTVRTLQDYENFARIDIQKKIIYD